MTDQPTQPGAEVATANVKQKSKGFSAVWVIPIVAALVGGWMVFQTLLEEKPVATVTFQNAAGIEAGKTVVKFHDIVIGKVTHINFTKGMGDVEIVMEFENNIEVEDIRDTTRFWVVKPRIGLGGVSGLDTLLSGAYIEADPGEGGKPATRFVGLEEPGIYQLGNPGSTYTLRAKKLGSLGRGAPVKYRDISVGLVSRYKLAEDNASVEIQIFIRDPYDKIVKKDTRFWNISGVAVDVNAEGIKVDMESVATLIAGGVAFSDNDSTNGTRAEAKSVFILHKTEKEEVGAQELAFYVPMKLYFENGVKGLEKDAPVTYKGLRLGTVDKIAVEASDDETELLTIAMIRIEPDRLPANSSYRDDPVEKRTKDVYRVFENWAAQGVRAQLQTGNLLTGKALVVFDHFPRAEKASIRYVDGLAVYPTIPPESLAGIVEKVDAILAKIDAIPMQEIGENLAELTAKLDTLPVGKISKDLTTVLDSINALVGSLDAARGGVLGVQTREALAEITRAARALRGMAEYLERHPEALLKGKK
jgi:paraquat-inducible protein B